MSGAIAETFKITHTGEGSGTSGPPDGGYDGESSGGGARAIPQRAYFTLVTVAMAAIVMFFMALTSSFILRKGQGGDWEHTRPPALMWLNTAVLLASSGTIEVARRRRAAGDAQAFHRWWGLTTLLGLAFLAGQLAGLRQLSAAGVFLASNSASSFFYVMTAAHGAHLLGGIVALLYVAFRAWERSRITQGTAAELASIYWHFVDGLWLFLFALLYLGG
jgi:cytochrome c oxidase subunit 3